MLRTSIFDLKNSTKFGFTKNGIQVSLETYASILLRVGGWKRNLGKLGFKIQESYFWDRDAMIDKGELDPVFSASVETSFLTTDRQCLHWLGKGLLR